MKVALCLSGQPRCYKECYEFVKAFVIDEYGGDDVDVFCHFWWDKEGDSAFESTSPWSAESLTENKFTPLDDIERGLIELYNPIDIKYDNPEDIRKKHYPNGVELLKKHIAKVYEYKHDHESKKRWIKYPRTFKKYAKDNLKQIFESQYKVQQMKKKYENDNNFKYDIVIRTRYDIAFTPFWNEKDGVQEEDSWTSRPEIKFNSRFRLLPSLSEVTDVWNGIHPMHKMCTGQCKINPKWKNCKKIWENSLMFTQWDNLWIYPSDLHDGILEFIWKDYDKHFRRIVTESIQSKDVYGFPYDFSSNDILATPENMQEHAINQIDVSKLDSRNPSMRSPLRAHDAYGMNAQLELVREPATVPMLKGRWEKAIKAGHTGDIWWK